MAVVLATLVLCPMAALAQEPGPSSQSQPAEEKKPESQPFVDRDGDGIQDGQERRFRRRHRGKNRNQDEERRRRQREGQGEPGKGEPPGNGR